jgi:hypothetical protein
VACRDQNANGGSEVFCDHRARGYSAHTHVQPEHEPGIEQHIADVEHQLQHQSNACLAHTDEPAEQGIVGERRWCGINANVEILPGETLDAVGSVEQGKSQFANRPLCEDQANTNHCSDQECPPETGAHFVRIVCTECLRSQSGGAHAQEPESPEDEAEHQGAERNSADQRCVGNLSNHAGVHHAEQWRGQIGNHDRSRNRQNGAVRDHAMPGIQFWQGKEIIKGVFAKLRAESAQNSSLLANQDLRRDANCQRSPLRAVAPVGNRSVCGAA